MRLISSRATILHKTVFPAVWFGVIAFVVAGAIAARAHGQSEPPVGLLLIPIGMAAFGFFLFRKLVWDLATAVFDCGDHLLVEKSGRKERVDLSNIINVSHSLMTSPERVTLTLREPSLFGREITFSPPIRFIPFSKSPVVEDLIMRIDALRTHP
jgi:hypothetical protein